MNSRHLAKRVKKDRRLFVLDMLQMLETSLYGGEEQDETDLANEEQVET